MGAGKLSDCGGIRVCVGSSLGPGSPLGNTVFQIDSRFENGHPMSVVSFAHLEGLDWLLWRARVLGVADPHAYPVR